MTSDAISRQIARRRSAISVRATELRALLLIGDATAAGIAVLLAPELWSFAGPEFTPHVDLRAVELTLAVVWLTLLRALGGGTAVGPRFGRRTLLVVTRTMFAASVVILAMFFFVPFFAPRGSTIVTIPLLGAATLVWRYGYLLATKTQVLEQRVAIVGTDAASKQAAAAMQQWLGPVRYRVIAFLASSDESPLTILGAPVVALSEDPWAVIEKLDVDLLVVGHTHSAPSSLLAELTRCFEHGVEAVPATMLYEQLTGRVLVAALEADWYAELPTYTHGVYVPVKRMFDIFVASVVGLLALVLTPIIAIAIVIDSGGPVMYRQVRVGLRGRLFVLHKFRTMKVDAEKDGTPQWATLRDPRVTRVGTLLRRTRLDELPQLLDVLLGRMSIIGPRPERPEFVERLSTELPLYRARSLVRPGISGWAQVQFPYASSIEENLAKLEYDLYYVRHLGPLLDVSITLRTIQKVLSLSGR